MELYIFLENVETQPVFAVHGIRKRTKFIRALLHLNPDSPKDFTSNIRSISRLLAPYRDAQVNLDTYQAIVSVNNSDRDTVFEDFLRQNQFLKQGFPEKSDLDKIQTYIEDCRSLLNSTPSKLAPDQILMSIETSYQLGNQALKRAQGDPSSELVHAWRKKTKRLWYQLRWMFGDDLDNPNHPVLQSNVLGKSLGEIHDLDVLRILLDIDHPLQLRIQKLRQVLLTRAFEMGFELYIYQRTNFHHSLNQLY